MAYSYVVYTGDGVTTQFAVPFPYIRREHVFVSLDYVSTTFTWINNTTVEVSPAPTNGERVEVRRVTPVDNPLVDFTDGSTLVAADLDTNALQQTYVNQEQDDQFQDGISINAQGLLDAGAQRITNVANPTSAQDAATKNWVETAGASPLVQFRSIFYGPLAADPATDPYGGAPTSGDLYFNTTSAQMRVYNGVSWQDASANAVITRFKFTATGGETSLTGADDNANIFAYDAGLELVYLNGALLTRGVDYVASNGTSITGLAALAAADFVEVVVLSQIDVVDSIPGANIADGTITTGKLADSSVTSAKIADGTIVNADVNASAAIAGTKVNPDFGSQNVVTTGTATAASLNPTGSSVPANGVYLPGANRLGIATNTTARLEVDASGRLLIGTSTAIGSDSIINIKGISPADAAIYLGRNANASTLVADNTLGLLRFGAGDGGLGASIAALADGTWSSTSDCPSRLVFSTTADGASSPTERMRLDSSGNWMLGTTSPGSSTNNSVNAVTADGRIWYSHSSAQPSGSSWCVFQYDGNIIGSITQSGTTGASFNTASDYRLKENVIPLAGAIDRVNQLQVRRFNFIADPSRTVDGFLAHEAQAVVPECVTGTKDEVDDDGNPIYQGIDQSKLVPLLTAALQEAIAKIETLEAKVAALEAA
jgi:hypothetical protein